MTGIIWEEPPQNAPKGRTNRLSILNAAIERPNTWARLGTWTKKSTAQQAASDVRCGKAIPIVAGDFESRWSEVEPGVWAVWVRWVPSLSNGS